MNELQLLLSAITVIGAGISSYLGVRIALAELRKDVASLKETDIEHGKRLERLEAPFFSK